MATLTPSATTGQALFDGTQSFRSKDDGGDPYVSGVFTHNPLEFSANEANEWIGFFMYLTTLLSGSSSTGGNKQPGQVYAGPLDGDRAPASFRYLGMGDTPAPVNVAANRLNFLSYR